MPNYDLGTAHGRIKIDVDDRGTTQANKNLTDFEKTMQSLDRRMATVQRSLSNLERDLGVIANDFRKAQEELDGFNDSLDQSETHFRNTSQSARLLTGDLRTMIGVVRQLKQAYENINPKIQAFRGFYNGFNQSGGGFSGVIRGLAQSGMAVAGLRAITFHLIGMKKAMANLSATETKLLRLSSVLGGLGGALLIIPKIASAMQKIGGADIFGRAMQRVARHSLDAGLALAVFENKAKKAFASMTSFSPFLNFLSGGLGKSFTNAIKSVVEFNTKTGNALQNTAKGITGTVFGIKLLKSGIQDLTSKFEKLGWIGKFVFGAIGASFAVGPALMDAFGKSLVGVSNLLVGLWNGVKQLSGAFLAIPGAISMMSAALSTGAVIAFGLKDAFKGIAKGGEDAVKALAAMPPHLQDIGKTVFNLMPQLRKFQTSIQSTFFAGFADQIKSVATQWIPVLQSGMGQVANSMRNAKDRVVEFLQENKTAKDVGQIYGSTARTIQTLSDAIKPLAAGFRDLAVVGASFIESLSANIPGLSQKFANFAKVNRENGNLMRWMEKSVSGAKDLVKGIVDATKATWKLLTIFASNNGEDFLQRFAASMKKLNDTIQKSAASGTLRNIGNAVRSIGTEHIKTFMEYVRAAGDAFKVAWPSLVKLANALSSTLVPAVRIASALIQAFFKALQFTGLDSVITNVISLVGALTLLWKIFSPVIALAKIFSGAIIAVKNFNTTINGLVTVMNSMGSAGATAAGTLSKVWKGIKLVTAAVTAATIAWSLYSAYQQKIDDGNKAIAESNRKAIEQQEQFRKSLVLDKGQIGQNAFDAAKSNVDSYMSTLQDSAGRMPSLLDHIVGFFDIFSNHDEQNTWNPLKGVGDPTEINRLQAIAASSQQVIDGFDGIKASSDDITTAITGNEVAFDSMVAKLMATGDSGKAAAGALALWRKEAQSAAADAAKLGEGGNMVVAGLQQIAKAAGNADEKLSGLKKILEGLGILKTSALDASMAYAEGIDTMAQKVTDMIDPTQSLTDIIDKQTGSFNAASANGRNLYNILKPIGEEYLNTVTHGGNAAEAYQTFADKAEQVANQLNAMAPGLNMTKEKIMQLSEAVGLVKPERLHDELQKMFNGPNRDVLIRMGINQATIDAINQQLKNGITVPSILPDVKWGNKAGDGPHGGWADRTKQAEKDQKDYQDQSVKEWEAYLLAIQGETDKAIATAKEGGLAFGENFAEGIREGKSAIQSAVDEVLKEARERVKHGSPPKKGPLSGAGWSGWGGRAFSRDFAKGIMATASQVTDAANTVAGAASTAVSNVTVGGVFGGTKAGANEGQFLGQLLELSGFAQRLSDVFSKITDTLFKSLKFISDPFSKGTFFGKSLGFSKTVTGDALAKIQGDAIQSALSSAAGNGRRDTAKFDTATGMMRTDLSPGMLARNASKGDVQAKIIAEAQKRGMTPEQIQTALAIAAVETGYSFNPQSNGGIQAAPGQVGTEADRVLGLYQQKASWGTADQRLDPNYAINKFLDAYQQQLKTTTDATIAGVLTQNPQLGSNAQGSDYYNKVANAQVQMRNDYASIIANPPKTSPGDVGLQTTPGAAIKAPGASINYTPDWMVKSGFPQLFSRDAQGNAIIPPWAQQMAAAFNLTVSSHIDNSSLHGKPGGVGGSGGWAFDFNSPTGNVSDMERFAQFLEQNMMGNLAQLIFRSSTRDYGVAGGQNVGGALGQGTYYTTGEGYSLHGDHVHGAFFTPPGVYPSTAQVNKIPSFLQDYAGGDTNKVVLQQNPQTGQWEQVTPHGANAGTAPGDINMATGKPYTDAERQALIDAFPKQYTLPDNMTFEEFQKSIADSNNYGFLTQDQMLSDLATTNSSLAEALAGKTDNYRSLTDNKAQQILTDLDSLIQQQQAIDTPISRARSQALQGLQSDIMGATGFSRNQNPIDTVASIASQAFGVASDVIGTITSGIEAIGAADDIAKTLVRGVANTKDVNRVIDDVQKFIAFGAQVSGAVSSVAGLIGSIAGAAGGSDPSGGSSGVAAVLGSISTVASLIQAGYETANAVIDLTQEATKIIGSYVGDFLGFLVGGPNGQLTGNVRFLLDQQTNQLLAYSAENPMGKATHNIPFAPHDTSSRQQGIGTINVYGGPGSDPRDLTRQMMFQVNSAQYAGALSQ